MMNIYKWEDFLKKKLKNLSITMLSNKSKSILQKDFWPLTHITYGQGYGIRIFPLQIQIDGGYMAYGISKPDFSNSLEL